MASAGDDGGLPDTDDPFELLGVDRGADPRELRRAYARLIKRFRPDRSPSEFQRIQAAYEHATMLQDIDDDPESAAFHEQSPAAAEASEPPPVALTSAPVAMPAPPGMADVTAEDLATEDLSAIAWRQLTAAHPPDRAAARWCRAFATAFYGGDLDRALALLDDAQLRDDAAADASLAAMALDRLVALAWKRALPRDLVVSYRDALAYLDVGTKVESSLLEISLADQLRGRSLPWPLVGLDGLLIAARIGSPEARRTTSRLVRDRLAGITARGLHRIAKVTGRPPGFSRHVADVLMAHLDDRYQREVALQRRVEQVVKTLPQHRIGLRYMLVLGLLAAAIVYEAFTWTDISGTLVIVAWSALLLSTWLYHVVAVRPALARAIHDHPVPLAVIVQWIRRNRQATGRGGWFEGSLAGDRPLELYSLLNAVADRYGDG